MQLLVWFIFTVISSTTILPITAQQDCAFLALRPKPNANSHLCPPIIADSSTPTIKYPNRDDSMLHIPNGKTIEITCSGRFIHLYINNETTKTNFQAVTAQCQGGNIFKILELNQNLDINTIFCMENPIHIAKYITSNNKPISCLNRGRLVEIGFQAKQNFLRQMFLCFDPKSQLAFSSTHTISPLTGSNALNTSSNFIPDSFYDLGGRDIDTFYNKAMEMQTINKQLGLPNDNESYIKNDGDYFLARGHLSPVEDFFYPIEQDATYHFINAVPHWQIINNGNWKLFEKDLRDFNARLDQQRGYPLEVTTGFTEITELPDVKGNQVPVYLYNREKKALPVPGWVWKIYLDPSFNTKVIVFGINNPYLNLLTNQEKYYKCRGDELQLSWLTLPDPENITKGVIYACDFNKILANYQNFPIFD